MPLVILKNPGGIVSVKDQKKKEKNIYIYIHIFLMIKIVSLRSILYLYLD